MCMQAGPTFIDSQFLIIIWFFVKFEISSYLIIFYCACSDLDAPIQKHAGIHMAVVSLLARNPLLPWPIEALESPNVTFRELLSKKVVYCECS